MNVEREEGYCCSNGFNSSWNRWSHTIGAWMFASPLLTLAVRAVQQDFNVLYAVCCPSLWGNIGKSARRLCTSYETCGASLMAKVC